jgi:hypothetical protein
MIITRIGDCKNTEQRQKIGTHVIKHKEKLERTVRKHESEVEMNLDHE